MKNYADSDYALSKYSAGIVYRFADGIAEVTLADYLADNLGKTEDDFMELKRISDDIYLEQVRGENAQTKKNTLFYESDETVLCCVPSPEDIFISEIDANEEAELHEQQLEVAHCILNKLTKVQRRRYLMHVVDGLTVRQIAVAEGVAHPSVVECLQAVDKKIKKLLANT